MTAVISAVFGDYDDPHEWAPQPAAVFRYTDETFPLRKHLTPHAQARMVKCFGWDLNPGYDRYIWVDGSYRLGDGATDFLTRELGDHDIVVFSHPFHSTIEDEYEYLRDRQPSSRYLQKRYSGEWLDEQYARVDGAAPVYHTAIFAYRDTPEVRAALTEWWSHISRFHLDDQLSFSHATRDLDMVALGKILDYPYFQYTRHKHG